MTWGSDDRSPLPLNWAEKELASWRAPRARGWWLASGMRWGAAALSRLVPVLLFLPTVIAGLYFFAVASNQFESEARFVVRSAARPEVDTGLSFLTQLGLGRSQDDSFIVQDFMTSRDAVQRLQRKLPLLEMYGRREADFVVRYPSIFFGATEEELYRYLQYAISIVHADKGGITTLRVRAFTAADAQQVARALLDLGEEVVNRLNDRLQRDAVGYSTAELEANEKRLIAAQAAMTDFRNRELVVDPAKNAVSLAELIARLSSELAATRAQIAEMMSGASSSPQLPVLQRKAAALDEQITRERSRINSAGDGLAERMAAYERLTLEREFANRMVTSAEGALVKARAEAARQMLYLERIVEPNLADYRSGPHRLADFLTVFAANCIAVLIGWLLLSGVREHAS